MPTHSLESFSKYDPSTKILPANYGERPAQPKPLKQTDPLQAARRRLRGEPVATWRERTDKFTRRAEEAAATVRELEAEYKAVAHEVARDLEGADAKQEAIHNALVKARGEYDKVSSALSVATAQLSESESAAEVVRAAEAAKDRAEAHEKAKAEARESVTRVEKALAELRDADTDMRSKVAAAVSFEPTREKWAAPFDLNYTLSVCYAADGVLPVKWAPKFYDQVRSGFTDPDSTAPRAAIPSIGFALSNHIE